MNILFLTMNPFDRIDMHNIYSDLMIEFINNGHKPYIVAPREKQFGDTCFEENGDHAILRVRIGNTTNVSFIEKGISVVLLESQFEAAINKYLGDLDFGLLLYSTPPITFSGIIRKAKKRYNAKSYLMLKDIFPQNAVDLGLFTKKSPIYAYFRNKEKNLYKLSDTIGCMSPANVNYVTRHNPYLSKDKVVEFPNAIIPHQQVDRTASIELIRKHFSVPDSSITYLFGGNLGKPQAIPFFIECLMDNMNKSDRFFIICGSGSDYCLIDDFIKEYNPTNIALVSFLPKKEYDALVEGCDVGLIFLDYRFTIPNFPSRVLSYMENSMPVIVCSDESTDIGKIAETNDFGQWCPSNDVKRFTSIIDEMTTDKVNRMGKKSRSFLENHYSANECYTKIMQAIQ